jgi:hypothetical protein
MCVHNGEQLNGEYSNSCVTLTSYIIITLHLQERQATQLSRCFLSVPEIREGHVYQLSSEAGKHLKALRSKSGDAIEIVNGQGALAIAEVVAISKREATVWTSPANTLFICQPC